MRVFFVLLLFLGLIVPLQAPAAETNAGGTETPADLPALLQRGIQERDSAFVLQRVDMEGILDAAVTENLPQINAKAGRGELPLSPPLAAALSALNSGGETLQGAAKTFLAAELRKFIAYGVESGAFAGAAPPHAARSLMEGGVFAELGVPFTRKTFLLPAKLLRQDEKNALIQVGLYDEGSRTVYPLRLNLSGNGPLWRITRVDNMEELLGLLAPPRGTAQN
ncbi:MAG: hypothetical protein LBD82_04970 [Deltaproteobacteria bacterium]|jgi:hypothetical protein|nr:hypothetical protein [Deltaproteobacteria bacterium]